MNRLHIPKLREKIVLAEDWAFTLYEERRNDAMIKVIDPQYFAIRNYWNQSKRWPVTIPAGTELSVDRIYIRASGSEFDSVTFRTTHEGKKVRFWAKLNDVNKIVMV